MKYNSISIFEVESLIKYNKDSVGKDHNLQRITHICHGRVPKTDGVALYYYNS